MQKAAILNRIKQLTEPLYPEGVGHKIRLSALSGIKCVAFDFYGTMFISAAGDIGVDEEQQQGHARFFEAALKDSRFNIKDTSAGEIGLQDFETITERYIEDQKKQGIDYPEPDIRKIWQQVLESLHQKKIIGGTVTDESTKRFAIEFEFRANKVWPQPDMLSTLKNLQKKGLTLGIISNSQFYTSLTFEAVMEITAEDFGFPLNLQTYSYRYGIKKPSLSFYQKFTDKLSSYRLVPEQVLFVGNDLFKDVIPAKKLGMKTALFVGDRRSVRHKTTDLIEKQLPDVIIDELVQIIEVLKC